ncbi:daf-6 [Cordylochernes scorpioides]|uniref:Daf-6 n=1 Tax=Cordylochernes scorpioides TaxID=51811 RepID=A0ABY6KJW5_9ARAC|nr:daf-6 [Cordylochernes scorpioides]
MFFFKDYYGKFLTNKIVKVVILSLFASHIAISIYGFTQLKTAMKYQDFYSYDSYVKNFSETELRYFSKYSLGLQFIIEEPLDYSKIETQKKIFDLIEEIQETPYFASEPILRDFWLKYYIRFIKSKERSFIIRGYNTSTKQGFINCLRYQFFKMKHSRDLRMISTSMQTTQKFYRLGLLFRCHGGCYLHLYARLHTWSIGITLPIFIELGIIGYMDFWGLCLNGLTLFSIILLVGLSVDNTAHILHAFMSSKESCPDKRMRDALGRVGLPIIQGCLSSVVGMIALSFLPAYAYQVLSKTGLMLLVFSLANSLAVIPVLLSLLSSCRRNRNKPIEQDVIKPLNLYKNTIAIQPPNDVK